MKQLNEYDKQAQDFCEKYGVTININFLKYDYHFENDKEKRDIYKVVISRGNRTMSVEFGQSMAKSGFIAEYGRMKIVLPISDSQRNLYLAKHGLLVNFAKQHTGYDFLSVSKDKLRKPEKPTSYDILTCLQKYDVGTFEEFCSEFGYNTDSIEALRTYKAVVSEYKDVISLFNDEEMGKLQEIQ